MSRIQAQLPGWIKPRLALAALVLAFVCFKVPHLHDPFYWDESWSYAPGLQLMYQHGPSLMPDAIDTHYSRGHPLLFYAAMASWMRIFGPSHFAMHSFALLLSVLLIIAVFEVGLRLFNIRVAYSTALFMAVQVAFFVQASMCLPEIMVALLTLLSLFFFQRRKYLLLWASLTALLFTKESGVVAGLVLGGAAVAQLFRKSVPRKAGMLGVLSTGAAWLCIVAFFLLQKKLNGWYFFPEHTGLIKLEFPLFWGKFRMAMEFLFNEDKRYWVFRALAIACAIGFLSGRRILAAPLLGTIVVLWALLTNRLGFIPDKLMPGILLALLLAVLAGLIASSCIEGAVPNAAPFGTLAIAFFILYLLFSGINFFTLRYLLCLLPIVALLVSLFFDLMLQRWHRIRFLWLIVPACFLVSGIRAFQRDSSWGDTHLDAYRAMGVQQSIVRFLEQRRFYNASISTQSFQTREHLTHPLTGMRSTDVPFREVRWDIDRQTDLVLFDNIEPDSRYELVRHSPDFHRIVRLQNGPVWAEVYQRQVHIP